MTSTEPVTHKHCNRCGYLLPLSAFCRMTASPDGHQYKCRSCINAYKAEWEERNPERTKVVRRNADIRRFGITVEDFLAMLEVQGGRCAVCGVKSDELHPDHDHACCPPVTMRRSKLCGKCVRGLLCSPCNRGLGMLRENVAVIRAGADYLERWRRDHPIG